MSVFNGEEFLAEAVESILAQTFSDFEFIIIDDGSTDKTAGILAGYSKRDARIRIFSQKNSGRAESLNRGMELAKAPLIARMDADDLSLPSRLKEQVEFLETHPSVGVLSGAYEQIDSSGRLLGTIRLPLDDTDIRAQMLKWNAMCHPAVMMRKDAALASGGYRKPLLDADDYDLWLRISERTQLANLEQVVLKYRIHARQASIKNMTHQAWCVLAAASAAEFRRRGEPDPLSDVREINPDVLAVLGVPAAEIQRVIVGMCKHWIALVHESEPELAIRINSGLSRLSPYDAFQRPVLADLWLSAGAAHFKRRRLARSVFSTTRALLMRPLLIGRPLWKMAVRAGAAFRT
jgi:hypothetical protein